jgi:hypothetical protein
VRVSPSTSESLARTEIVIDVSSLVVALFAFATGKSLTGVMVTETVAVAVAPAES